MVCAKRCSLVALTAGIAFGLLVLPAGAAQKPAARKSAAMKKQAAPAPAPAPAPVVPLSPEQMPANPPQVSYTNGQLSILAQNSTLGDILRAVRSTTGADVEVPSNATERVVSKLGPGPARDVLATLLNGSHFNYVMLGSAADPDSVQRVILTAKSGGVAGGGNAPSVVAEGDTGNGGQSVAPPPPPPPAQAAQADELDDSSDELGDDNTMDADNNQNGQPNQQPQVMQPGPNPQQQPGAAQPGIKSPEQLLQELQLRNQQMQQQQQQQQENPQPPQ